MTPGMHGAHLSSHRRRSVLGKKCCVEKRVARRHMTRARRETGILDRAPSSSDIC